MKNLLLYKFILFALVSSFSCCEDDTPPVINPDDYDPGYSDDYSSIAGINNSGLWGPYNLHDPSIIKFNNEYYIFSTDVMYGGTARAGVMRRKSEDLVKWFYRGWVFDAIPDAALNHITGQGYTAGTIWAPFAFSTGDEIRLYYSVSVFGRNVSAIGMAVAPGPNGPWEDKGVVISTTLSSSVNAIDPAVISDHSSGRQWMAYGSYWSGIYIVELDPLTGMRMNRNDYGKRIAARSSAGMAIEGAEILYNPEINKYFLFVSYDWLEDTYNVRVGRSDHPEGPYTDFFGDDMAAAGENFPVLTAWYGFNNHPGWQGFGHCALLHDGDKYFYVSQARPSSNKYLMNLHVRRMLWTPEGWPLIAPERYVDIPQTGKSSGDIPGTWEYIYLEHTGSKNSSVQVEFLSDGTISGIENSGWSFKNNLLTLNLQGGAIQTDAILSDEWDWENDTLTICFSGISNEGKSVWGKKISDPGK